MEEKQKKKTFKVWMSDERWGSLVMLSTRKNICNLLITFGFVSCLYLFVRCSENSKFTLVIQFETKTYKIQCGYSYNGSCVLHHSR